jgi:hypothetical protein
MTCSSYGIKGTAMVCLSALACMMASLRYLQRMFMSHRLLYQTTSAAQVGGVWRQRASADDLLPVLCLFLPSIKQGVVMMYHVLCSTQYCAPTPCWVGVWQWEARSIRWQQLQERWRLCQLQRAHS